jgi:hypothetical protein
LDEARSWIVTDEVNLFTWPGPDLRAVVAGVPGSSFAYGQLPARLVEVVLDMIKTRFERDPAFVIRRENG